LAYYLRAGLPVIVNRDSSIAEVVDAQQMGVSVPSAADIGNALRQVSASYAARSAAATRFFDQHLDFNLAFGEVLRRVDALR